MNGGLVFQAIVLLVVRVLYFASCQSTIFCQLLGYYILLVVRVLYFASCQGTIFCQLLEHYILLVVRVLYFASCQILYFASCQSTMFCQLLEYYICHDELYVYIFHLYQHEIVLFTEFHLLKKKVKSSLTWIWGWRVS